MPGVREQKWQANFKEGYEQLKKQAPKKHHQCIIIDGEMYYKPYSEEAKERAKKLKNNQFVHFSPVSETDQRSVSQLGLYWQACKFISERVDNIDWSTQKHVDFQIRMSLKFFDLDYIFYCEIKKQVSFKLLSISFENLPHIQACNYFNQAYEVMFNVLPTGSFNNVDEMIEAIKASCKGAR